MENYLSKTMWRLPFSQRHAISEEIHGVRCLAPVETPEMVEFSLKQLELTLQLIPSEQKRAFCKCQELFPYTTYANDRDFRLRFLRTELFNTKEAAIRMVNYIDFIAEAFPVEEKPELFERMIRLKDLEEDDETHSVLLSGSFRLLDHRDRSGRRVLVCFLSKKFAWISMTARIRVAMYLFTIASNDVESQRRGIVVLVLPAKRSGGSAIKPKKRGVNRLEKKFHEAIPMRIAAIHARSSDICSHDLDWIRVVRAMGTMNVIRLKLYCDGTSKDIKNDLTGFGIPFGAIPNANENLMGRWKWVETRKRIEEMQREAANGTVDIKILECPGLKDVIFQTAGKSWALHPGDVFYRSLIEFSHAQHSTSNQTGKKILVNGIVDLIESRNGRFLACDDRGFWVQLENRKDIRKKVALSLRNFNVLSKKRRAGGPKGKKTCVKKGRSRRIVVEL